jgi:dihydroneopterin aldolase
VHTGIYSEETGRPQPLRFSVGVRAQADRALRCRTSLDASKNYMDLKFACSAALGDTHFKLIEAVADHVCETLFLQDNADRGGDGEDRQAGPERGDEKIGITLHRERR